jgi:undecaprenyl-diphosphatase
MTEFRFITLKHARLLVWLALTFLFLGLFLKLTWELHEDSTLEMIDRRVLLYIADLRIAALNGPAVDVTALGSPTVVTVITVIGLTVLWLAKDVVGMLYLSLGLSGAGLITTLVKHLFTRARPTIVPKLVEVSGFSYPSGHSLAATSLYLALMFLSWKRFRSWMSRFVLLCCSIGVMGGVALSRIYLGVHYPSDVISGIFLGAAWMCFLTAWFSWFNREHSKNSKSTLPRPRESRR